MTQFIGILKSHSATAYYTCLVFRIIQVYEIGLINLLQTLSSMMHYVVLWNLHLSSAMCAWYAMHDRILLRITNVANWIALYYNLPDQVISISTLSTIQLPVDHVDRLLISKIV